MNKAFRNHLILCAVFSGLLLFAIVLAAQSALPLIGKLALAAGFLALAAYLWAGLARSRPQPPQDDSALLKARLHAMYNKEMPAEAPHTVAAAPAKAATPAKPIARAESALPMAPVVSASPVQPAPPADAVPVKPVGTPPPIRAAMPVARAAVLAPATAPATEETLAQVFARIRPVAELDGELSTPKTESERRAEFERRKAADLERQRRSRARIMAAGTAGASSASGTLHPVTTAAGGAALPLAGAAPVRCALPEVPEQTAPAKEPQAEPIPMTEPPAPAEKAEKPAPRLDPKAAMKAAAAYAQVTGKVPPAPALEVAMAAGVSLNTPLDELPPLPDEEETDTERAERNRVLVEAKASAQQLLKDRAIHRALEEARQREGRMRTIEQSQALQAHRHAPLPDEAPAESPEFPASAPPLAADGAVTEATGAS